MCPPLEVRGGFTKQVMLEQSCGVNGRLRAFQAAWTSELLGGAAYRVSSQDAQDPNARYAAWVFTCGPWACPAPDTPS